MTHEQVFDDIDTVVAHILGIRPNARVALCSYDYVAQQGHNAALGEFAHEAVARTAGNPDYYFINNLGLMHYTYGYPGEFGPAETPFPGGYPDYAPLMGGDPSLPGPPVALADSIHLTGAAYLVLAERCVDEFYADWLTGLEEPVPVGNGVALPLLTCICSLVGVYVIRRENTGGAV